MVGVPSCLLCSDAPLPVCLRWRSNHGAEAHRQGRRKAVLFKSPWAERTPSALQPQVSDNTQMPAPSTAPAPLSARVALVVACTAKPRLAYRQANKHAGLHTQIDMPPAPCHLRECSSETARPAMGSVPSMRHSRARGPSSSSACHSAAWCGCVCVLHSTQNVYLCVDVWMVCRWREDCKPVARLASAIKGEQDK